MKRISRAHPRNLLSVTDRKPCDLSSLTLNLTPSLERKLKLGLSLLHR